MFRGVYEMKLGRDGRLTIPRRMRLMLGDSAVITRIAPDYLTIFTESDFDSTLDYLRGQTPIAGGCDKRELVLPRAMLGAACAFRLDGRGRFRVPEHLRRAAQLEVDVTVVGAGNHIEIWSARLWEQFSGTDPGCTWQS